MANLTTTQGQQETGNSQVVAVSDWSGWSATTIAPTATLPTEDTPSADAGGSQAQPTTETWSAQAPESSPQAQAPQTLPEEQAPSTSPEAQGTTKSSSGEIEQPIPQPATISSITTSGSDTTLPAKNNEDPQQAESSIIEATTQNTISNESITGGAVLMIAWELVAALVIVTICYYWYTWLWEWYEKYKKDHPQPMPPPCETCGGSGSITKKVTKSAPCWHCKETWRDICHHCGGSGKNGLGLRIPETEEEVASLLDCNYCGGKGFSDPPIACCMCKWKSKIDYQETVTLPCPDCRKK